jgi:hypothetical protein
LIRSRPPGFLCSACTTFLEVTTPLPDTVVVRRPAILAPAVIDRSSGPIAGERD